MIRRPIAQTCPEEVPLPKAVKAFRIYLVFVCHCLEFPRTETDCAAAVCGLEDRVRETLWLVLPGSPAWTGRV